MSVRKCQFSFVLSLLTVELLPGAHRGCVRAVRLQGQRGEPHLLQGDSALALQEPGGGLTSGKSR